MDFFDSLIARDIEELIAIYVFFRNFEPTRIWTRKVFDFINREDTESFQKDIFSSLNKYLNKDKGELILKLFFEWNQILNIPNTVYRAEADLQSNAKTIVKETMKIISESDPLMKDETSTDKLVEWELNKFFVNLKNRIMGIKDTSRDYMLDTIKDYFKDRPQEQIAFLAGAASAKNYSPELMMESFLDEKLGSYFYRLIDYSGTTAYSDFMFALGKFNNLWGYTIGMDDKYHLNPGIAMLLNTGFVTVAVGQQAIINWSSQNIKRKIMPLVLTQITLSPITYLKDRKTSTITQALSFYSNIERQYADISESLRISRKILSEIEAQQNSTKMDIEETRNKIKEIEKDKWETQVEIFEYFFNQIEERDALASLGFENEVGRITAISSNITLLKEEIEKSEKSPELWDRLSSHITSIFKNQEIKKLENDIRAEIKEIIDHLLVAWETNEQDVLRNYIKEEVINELEELAKIKAELRTLNQNLKTREAEFRTRDKIIDGLEKECEIAEKEKKNYLTEYPALSELSELEE